MSDESGYKIGFLEERDFSLDILIEVYAQLTRFVVRNQMSEQEAAQRAISMTRTLCNVLHEETNKMEKTEKINE